MRIFFITILMISFSLKAETVGSFIQQADQLARLEARLERRTSNWQRVIPTVLSDGGAEVAEAEKINSPKKYYSLSVEQRRNFKNLNKKMNHLEGLFPEKEYLALVEQISLIKKKIRESKKNVSAAELKKFISDFQQSKLDINPTALDSVIGMDDYFQIEESFDPAIYKSPDLYYNYSKENSQTDYADLRLIFQYLQLKPTDIFYDLGSGYGRVCTYGGVLFPEVRFTGIELVRERSDHANASASTLALKNVKSVAGDVLKENFDDGTVFYLLNPFPSIMHEVMPKLRKIASKKPIKIIAGYHTAIELKHVDWLEIEKDLTPERLHNPLIVYRSK